MLDLITRGVRYLSLAMVATSFAGAVALILVGTEKMFRAIWNYSFRIRPAKVVKITQHSDVFIVRVLETLDAFLIALALLGFGYGILTLLVLKEAPSPSQVPKVLLVDSIGALKRSLVQVVIVVLAVYFVRILWLEQEDIDFTVWAIPGSILMIAAAMRLWRSEDDH